MKTVTDKQVLGSIEKNGINADVLANELGISKSNAFYRIRQLKQKGKITDEGEVIHVSQAKLSEVAVNRESNDVEEIVPCNIDFQSLKNPVDPNYFLRDIDTQLEDKTSRGRNVVLIGDAGSGKTKSVEQLGSRLDVPFLRIACDDTTVLKEMLGRREIKGGTTYFRTGLLFEVVQVPSVILFDEFNSQNSSRLFFLHELLDNRRLLIKDADGGRIINLHPECRIALACNYNNAKYSGTNKTNVALGDRTSVFHVEPFDPKTIKKVFDTGDAETTKSLMKFYIDVNNAIRSQDLRMVFSLRGVSRITEDLKAGDSVKDALTCNLFNHALLTARREDAQSLEEIARVVFGVHHFTDGVNDNSNSVS